MKGALLGCSYTKNEVVDTCTKQSLPYMEVASLLLYTQLAKYINDGKVVGWYQDAMEFGPRSLGNRSIIGDAQNTKMQSQMNLKIKQRESFRPFAPAVLSEHVSNWFMLDVASPHMVLVANVKSEHCIMFNNNKP